jgi:DNA-binding transcriptional LysR family regulator
MRLRHIEILHAIKQTGSITSAAAALFITQPAVSKILKHAEQQLGFALFRRTRGRLYPTDQAELLLAEIEKAYEYLERARCAADVLRQGLDRHLRVVCLPSLGIGVVPNAVRRFRKQSPRTSIELACRHTQEINSSLLAREFDVGIGFGPADGSDRVPGIETTLITTGEMVYIDHVDQVTRMRSSALGPIKLAEINDKRLIGLNSTHYLGVALRTALQREGLTLFPAIQVQTYYVACALVAVGTGCAVIDQFTAIAAPDGVVVRHIDPPLRFGVYGYAREQQPLSNRAIEFLECVRAVCREGRERDGGARTYRASSPATATTALTNVPS